MGMGMCVGACVVIIASEEVKACAIIHNSWRIRLTFSRASCAIRFFSAGDR